MLDCSNEKIVRCEATYAARNLPTDFKLTPVVEEDGLDGLLAGRNYEKVATT